MSEAWRNRIIGSGEEAPDQLVANPSNWRTHPAAQRMALRGALSTVGWVQQILVNQRTGHVVDGHARVEEALSKGEATVPVLYVDLSPEEEALVLATLDPIGAMATRDDERLRTLLAEVSVDDDGLNALLAAIAPPKPPGLTDPDDVPEVGDDSGIVRGDLFTLGDHRLMCGDSTSAEDVARLLGGAKPNLMVTDPPYGVEYDPSWRPAYKAKVGRSTTGYALGTVTNDDRADWNAAWELAPSNIAYVWHGGLHVEEAWGSLRAAGFELRAQVIWVKQRPIFGRGAYHWQHEPCYYAVRGGATADWVGKIGESTVWEVNTLGGYDPKGEEDTKTEHSTQKPVECMERPIRNHRGDVYEPFAGSGSTVIAAERQGRRCYAMEIEPRYVAVTIKRWEQYTGRTAEKLP